MSRAPQPQITTATEPTTIGFLPHQQREATLTTIAVGNHIRHIWQDHTGTWEDCGNCNDQGRYPSDIHNGVCFHCGGRATGRATTVDRSARLARDSFNRARRKAEAADAHTDAKLAEGTEWRETNPELATALLDLFTKLAKAPMRENTRQELDDGLRMRGTRWSERTDADFVHAHGEAMFGGRFKLLVDYVGKVYYGFALTDRQATCAAEMLENYRSAIAEYAAQRYAGQIGETVTITGIVAKTITVDGYYGPSRMVVIDGTGECEGVTIKTFSTAKAMRALDEGQAVTVTGEVKKHAEYDGTKQTEVKRPKVS